MTVLEGKQGKLDVEWVSTGDLLPYARNSRVHSDFQVNQIAASIKEFGFLNPVLIDPEGQIIAGHGRVMASLKLGWENVPCIRLGHLTENQKRAYVIADNKLGLNASWDRELLKLEISDLKNENFDLEILGFEKQSLDEILGNTDGLDLSKLADGEGEGTTTTSSQSGTGEASHVRMVQLFLDDTSQPLFLDRCQKLQETWGTETLTDTVIEAIKLAAEKLEA